MSRNAEWQLFVEEVKDSAPPHIEFSAQNAVWKAKNKIHVKSCVKAPLTGIFAIIIIFVTLANLSLVFGKTLEAVPMLRKLAKLVTFNPNMRVTTSVTN